MSKIARKTPIEVATKIQVLELSGQGLNSTKIQQEIDRRSGASKTISGAYIRAIVKAARDGGYFPEGMGEVGFRAVREFASGVAVDEVMIRTGIDRARAEKIGDIVAGGLVPVAPSATERPEKKAAPSTQAARSEPRVRQSVESPASPNGGHGVDILVAEDTVGRIDFVPGKDSVALELMKGVWEVLAERQATKVDLKVSGPIGPFAKDVSAEAMRHAKETGERVGIEVPEVGIRYYANPD